MKTGSELAANASSSESQSPTCHTTEDRADHHVADEAASLPWLAEKDGDKTEETSTSSNDLPAMADCQPASPAPSSLPEQQVPMVGDPSFIVWAPQQSLYYRHGTPELLLPLALTSASSVASQQELLLHRDQAVMLQAQMQLKQEIMRLRQSLGLVAHSYCLPLPDHGHQTAAVSGLHDNTLALFQRQRQPLLNSAGKLQVAALLSPQLPREQQQQQVLPAAVLPLPANTGLNSSLSLMSANPQVAAMSSLLHLQPRMQLNAGSLAHHSSHSRASSQSPKKNPEASSPEPIKRPKRPLTSYNFFFKARREQLLAEQQQTALAVESERSNHKEALLKRPPRNSIGFEEIAKIIGKEWKEIDLQTLAEYKAQAQKDKERYLQELAVYKASKNVELEAKRVAMEQSVSDEVRQRYFAEVKKGKKRKNR